MTFKWLLFLIAAGCVAVIAILHGGLLINSPFSSGSFFHSRDSVLLSIAGISASGFMILDLNGK